MVWRGFVACFLLVSASAWEGCVMEEEDPCDPSRAVTMTVSYHDRSASVDLGLLGGERRGDLCLVPLDRIVETADLGIDLERTRFDFEAADGFRPSQVDCAPLDGTVLARGWADMGSGTLVWDEIMELRGCYSVTRAVTILASDAE